MASEEKAKLQLRIRFCGLCFFVKDQAGALHVLLPGLHGHGEHCAVEEHVARLHTRSNGQYDQQGFLLDGCRLDFAPAGEGTPGEVPDEVFNFRKYPWPGSQPGAGSVVPEALANPGAGGRVRAQLILRAGSGAPYNPGGDWDMPNGEVVWMATVLDWVIPNLPGNELLLIPEALPGAAGQCALPSPLRLTPDPGSKEILILVSHRPAKENDPDDVGSTPKPSNDTHATHFPAYYPLVRGTPHGTLPRNRHPGGGDKGDLVTCMLAQSNP